MLENYIDYIRANFKLTYLLIGINIVMFFLTYLVAALFETSFTGGLYILGGEFFPDIVAGQYWRLVLPMFLHGGVFHLLINMWALYNIGVHIENFYGRRKLLLIYLLTGLGGSLASTAVSLLQLFSNGDLNSSYSIGIGASGAIFGLIGVLIGNNYKKDTYTPKIPVDTNQLWIFVGYNLLLGFGINFFGGPILIGNDAHIGGLICGLLLGLIIDPIHAYYKSKTKKVFEQILFVISLLILIISLAGYFIFLFV